MTTATFTKPQFMPLRYRVEIHKRGGGYHSKPFRSLGQAKDFFALHTDNFSDLVELKEWQPNYKEPEWRIPGAWVLIEQFFNGA